MRTYLGYVPTSDTVQIPIFQFYTPTSPHNNTQAIPPTVGTHPRCVRREATGGFRPTYFRFRSGINALRSPWIFGRTRGTSLRLTQHCKLSILHSDITSQQHTSNPSNRRDHTPGVSAERQQEVSARHISASVRA